MKLKVMPEHKIKIDKNQLNINEFINVIYMSQKDYSRTLLQEVVEVIDRKDYNALILNGIERYHNKDCSKREF